MYTPYQYACYCKPNLNYYRDILRQLNVNDEECLMVGNDVSEDMVAAELGMKVFLLTDCVINKNNAYVSDIPHGSFDSLGQYITAL